ncbi:MAG TPA: glycosyltransferase [Longimicrobium sp.]|nr:glycosyltransferase [Longimicrobium sp.]
MADPLVSIILPTYNRLPLLKETVASIRAQTFGDWELLVVDDGSTDGTAEYLDALAREDPRVRHLPMPHAANVGLLRNAAQARARGRWVAFQDSDDTWRPCKLQRHLDAHAAEPVARWSYGRCELVDAAGNPLPPERFESWKPLSGWVYEALLAHRVLLAIPTLFAERALLDEVGGSDETLKYCEDYDLELRLAARAPCVALDEPLARIRQHAGSFGRDRLEVDEYFIRVYRKHAALRPGREAERICRRRQGEYALAAARKRMRNGEPGRALRWILYSARMRPASLAPWRLLAAGLLGRLRGPAPA